jgi:uncharacterized membrane protein (UPF0182 family)
VEGVFWKAGSKVGSTPNNQCADTKQALPALQGSILPAKTFLSMLSEVLFSLLSKRMGHQDDQFILDLSHSVSKLSLPQILIEVWLRSTLFYRLIKASE